jgi:hypothetical protein
MLRRFSTGYREWIKVERQQTNWRENIPVTSVDALGNDVLDVVGSEYTDTRFSKYGRVRWTADRVVVSLCK